MTWRNAKALDVFKKEITEAYPGRKPGSLQTIGDPNHSSRESQHNPNAAGVVTAIDVMNDKAGPDGDWLCDYLVKRGKAGDPRIWYIVWDRHIYSDTYNWVKQEYKGTDPHTSHVHMSLKQTPAAYDNTAPWGIEGDDMEATDKVKSTPWAESVTGWDNQSLQACLTRTQAYTKLARQDSAAALAIVKAMAEKQLTAEEIEDAVASAIAGGIVIDVEVTPAP